MPNRLSALMAFACFLILSPSSLFAQNVQHTENKPDLGLRSDARVDPSTLGMSFSIPLASYPGRAGHGLPVAITYSSKALRLAFDNVDSVPISGAITWTRVEFAEHSTAGWTSTLTPPRAEFTGMGQYFTVQGSAACPDVCVPGQTSVGDRYIKRIHVHMPDGSSHELRLDDQVYLVPLTPFTGTFHAVDGSRMRFESNAGSASVLYLPDGSRYLFGPYNNGTELTATHFIDRHGNTLTYNAGTRQWTDTLNRVITSPLPANPVANTDTYFMAKQVGGLTESTFTLRWKYLADVLTPDPATNQPPPLRYPGNYKCAHNSYQNLSPSLTTSSFDTRVCVEQDGSGNPLLFNPVVLAEVVLPTGKFYRFTYTVYGEIDKILLTTGATDKFSYGEIPTLSLSKAPYNHINRGVIERRVSKTGSPADESVWTYAVTSTNPYTVRTTRPDASYTERLIHKSRYTQSGGPSSQFDFDDARMGMVYEERSYDRFSVMLRRQLSEWVEGGTPGGAARDPKVIKQVSIILDGPGSNALWAMTVNRYDQPNQPLNLTSVTEYGFDDTKSKSLAQTDSIDLFNPPDTLAVRTTETVYLDDAAYFARGLTALPVSVTVRSGMPGGPQRARSEIAYDQQDTNHALLPCGATVGWSDPGTTVRGNATTTRSWLNTTGVLLQTHTQYDQCGNVRKIFDARDTTYINPAQIEYSPTYEFAYATLNTSPDPDGAGPQAPHTSSTEYDLATGLVTATIDANSQRTEFAYNDPLNRLKQVIRAATHASVKNQTTYEYDDSALTITVKSDLNTYGDQVLKTVSLFDGLGRATESRQYEGGDNFIAVKTEYDAMGRPFKTSNPFRQSQTIVWTEQTFDDLGRVISVKTPDNAVVATEYKGDRVLVTDPQGKQRMSRTNALGHLKEVFEVTPNDPAQYPGIETESFGTQQLHGYKTQYEYDVLDNLVKVTQGTQPPRYFMYDSVKRLTRARNPEQNVNAALNITDPITQNSQWTAKYQYDNNGNLEQKTDARNITITYAYDALNRNTSVNYSNTTIGSPDVPDIQRIYDNSTAGAFGIGRLRQSYAGGNETVGSNVEKTEVNSYDALGRPKVQSQRFKTNGTWGTSVYETSRNYDLAGNVTSQTYPSGNAVTYHYDTAGRADIFAGNLGDGYNRTYSTGIIYSPFGGLAKEQFGTATPLFNKQFYNNRGQLAEIRVGTTYTGPTDTGSQRGAIINHYSAQCAGACSPTSSMTDNNGNLRQQDHWIPNSSGTMQAQYVQTYDYDALNRLKRVTESANWKQEYTYDRWGNRKIHQTNTVGFPKPNFGVNESKNQLTAPIGSTMSYDDAGNLTTDTFTGTGTGQRIYDADNRMTQAWGGANQMQFYTYNADGQRTRRKINGQETWQVYGFEGELLAEYAANGNLGGPQKEYGYRNGQLLITAEPGVNPTLPLFADDFNDNSLDPSKWSVMFPTGTPPVTEQAQQIRMTLAPNTAGYNGVSSNSTFDMTGKMVQVEVAQAVSQAGWCENLLELQLNPNNTFLMNVGGGNLLMRSRVNGVNDQTSILYDSVAHRHWRIRHDATANTVNFETSADSTVWLTRKTVTPGFALTALRIYLVAGAWGTGNGAPGTAKYDNVKLLSSSAGPSSITIPNSGFETPSLGFGNFQYGPTGGSWSFINGAGISAGGSGFTGGPFPQGTQGAFIQSNGEFSQSLSGFQANTSYVVTFFAAQRTNCCNPGGQQFAVYLDGTLLGTFNPPLNGVYLEYSTAAFTTASGSHTLKFVGLNPGGQAGFIDHVRINGSPLIGNGVQWLVSDHLGTPRMVIDQTGTLANIKRHDYLPFGEEIFAGSGGRTAENGYASGDGVRQQFTQKERDTETGLDYFLARYYSSTQGRFTSPDEFTGGPDELYDFTEAASENPTLYADLTNPQSLNKYQYTYNNPLNMVDPDGHCPDGAGTLCWALPTVASIPGVREAAAAVAVVVIVSRVIKTIPGDNSQGDGSCPACDGYIKAFQNEKAREQAAQQQQQQRQNQGSSQEGSPQGQQQGEAQQQLGPNGGQRNAADQKRLDVQRERRNTRRENRSRDAAGQNRSGEGYRNKRDARKGKQGERPKGRGGRNRERNVGIDEEHSRVEKGRGGRGARRFE